MSSSANGKNGSANQPVIEINRLTRQFKTTMAVDDLSFKVMSGEVFGFIGPNGAGKTTTMRILSTLDTPTSGHAWVDGFSVVNDPDRVRSRLGFMPDGFGTYPNVTCEEYLDFFARSYGLRAGQRRAALSNVMDFTQLDRLAQKPVDGLSKGMRQRLCLGRALIHDPSVLILDEPAAGLDPRARIELREMIVRLASQGKALLISSHILTELAEMCDRVAIIEKGKLLAVGTVDEILENAGRSAIATSASQEPSADLPIPMLQLQVLGDVETARNILENKSGVSELSVSGNKIQFMFGNDLQQRAMLLKELVDCEVEVIGFRVLEKSLEDAFLQVTKGLVQ